MKGSDLCFGYSGQLMFATTIYQYTSNDLDFLTFILINKLINNINQSTKRIFEVPTLLCWAIQVLQPPLVIVHTDHCQTKLFQQVSYSPNVTNFCA